MNRVALVPADKVGEGWSFAYEPTVTCSAQQSAVKGRAELLARDSCTERSALSPFANKHVAV